MKKIDLEAHLYTEDYVKYLRSRKGFPKIETIEDEKHQKFERLWFTPTFSQTRPIELVDKLLDLGQGRINDMDAIGIDVQVLSLCDPGCEPFPVSDATPLARQINDEMANVINKYPDRFVGLATLAPQDPEEAAKELERTVRQLGFRGAKINSNINGEYLDDPKFWPILETAERLDVPINIHPMIPSPSMLAPYAVYGFALAGGTLGFAAETALHAMRMVLGGVFDKYPRLKIILGHLGEGLPFWGYRLNSGWVQKGAPGEPRPKCIKRPTEYINTNFILTTSGMFYFPALLCSSLSFGTDKITFATDYPFVISKSPGQYMEDLQLTQHDKEKICHLNAEHLFKLRSS